jgi:tRNA(Arg) A34 adenosine deaminase TadA
MTLDRRRFLRGSVAAGLEVVVGSIIGGAGCGGDDRKTVDVPRGALAAMRRAVSEARASRFPFGAALLDPESGVTVWSAHNTSESGDPTAHAEVNVLREAGLAGLDLSSLWLVTTAESCPMCAAAEVWSRVLGVVYGTSIEALIGFGWPQIDLPQREVMARSLFSHVPVIGGFLRQETDPLYGGGPG